MPKVTPIQINNLAPKIKQYKVFDEHGLFIIIRPNNSKLWRFRYTYRGKSKELSLGTYPHVSLKDARLKRDEFRQLLISGQNPSDTRKFENSEMKGEYSFEHFALLWHKKQTSRWTEAYAAKVMRQMELNILPSLQYDNIHSITPKQMITLIRSIEDKGTIETARRVKQIISQIFRFAVATGECESDPTRDIGEAMATSKVKHYATITDPEKIKVLISKIDRYPGTFVTRSALQLIALVFLRPGEIANAEWNEIHFELKQWHIPAERMKMNKKHIIPLSNQSIKILTDLHLYTGDKEYLFPHNSTPNTSMNRETLRCGLRRLGYKTGEMTAHGFRSMASTRLHEMGWQSDVIERQLAHTEQNKIKGAYNYAEHLDKRTEMMQFWADYLDDLKSSN